VLHAALHRQQPHRHLVLRQQQRPHFSFNADERFLPVYQFAAEDNKKITHLDSFAEKFLAKCTLGQMISRYMVLVASEQKLLMMRPYQIYAVQGHRGLHPPELRQRLHLAHHRQRQDAHLVQGLHLLKDNPDIDKCLFVVDRKDLDRQTREEFNRFQEGCVEENTNTETLVRRLLSDDYADKVIVTTIQKLGLALDGTQQAQLQGTPGAAAQQAHGLHLRRMPPLAVRRQPQGHQGVLPQRPAVRLHRHAHLRAERQLSADRRPAGQLHHHRRPVPAQCLHAYTITHAIEDRNVLRFHVDYYKPEGKDSPSPAKPWPSARWSRPSSPSTTPPPTGASSTPCWPPPASTTPSSTTNCSRPCRPKCGRKTRTFVPLNIACVFSPPAEGNKDVQQIQEDLPQEKADNQQDPEGKKAALTRIIADYNARYGTNHRIGEFDLYYQDVQKRIKDQQYPNADLPHAQKIDITIVVDMLLTGFDSKYLNTLYVDKNLKHHGLIQAFSRTNRVLNDSKPYGNVLDFRQQQKAVDEAIALFSGEKIDNPREIWLVEPAAEVLRKYEALPSRAWRASWRRRTWSANPSRSTTSRATPRASNSSTASRKCSASRPNSTNTPTWPRAEGQDGSHPAAGPAARASAGVYLETAKRLKEQQAKRRRQAPPAVQQLDFEFVLFASSLIDYDYIMGSSPADGSRSPARPR
jgi:type I restriction enzyme R subunit